MPELLIHYSISLLISSRISRLRYAFILALIGLLPDIDVFLMIHRWATHSIIVIFPIGIILLILFHIYRKKLFPYIAIGLILYVLHIVLDLFTAPVPILWPLLNYSYLIDIGLIGSMTSYKTELRPYTNIEIKDTDFMQKPVLEGPIVSGIGISITISIAITIILEYMLYRLKHKQARVFKLL